MNKQLKRQIIEKSPFVVRNGFFTTERQIVRNYQLEGERIYKFLQYREPDEIDMIIHEMKPLAFEELIITALCDHGYIARHGKGYSRDHGIDGWVTYNGENHPIQIKRYNGQIPTNLVTDFATICNSFGTEGLFIYTGRLSRKAYTYTEYMQLIGGARLLELLQRESNFYLSPEDALSQEDLNYEASFSNDGKHMDSSNEDENFNYLSLYSYLLFLEKRGFRPGLFLLACFFSLCAICCIRQEYGIVTSLILCTFFLTTSTILFIISKKPK